MATIQKRTGKTGTSYLIRVSAGYGSDGKQIIKSKTWRPSAGMTEKQTERELRRVAAEFEQRIENGDTADTSNLRLADFCKQYLDLSKTSLSPTTYSYYVRTIDSLIVPSLGHMKLTAIRPIHVQQFIQALQEPGARSDGKGTLSASSVRRYFTVLKSIMAKAYKLGLIDRNPTDTARLDLPKIEEEEVEVFSKDEAAHLMSCLESEPLMYRVLIHLAIVTGARRGELVALKWEHIDQKRKTIKIVQSNYKVKGGEIKTKPPKTQKSTRELSIPDYLISMLNDLRREQMVEALKLGDAWHNEGWIFTQWNGAPMYPSTPTLWFSKFQERHNIPHRKFHALRHTSGTLLLSSGTNIKTVASRLGHTQLSTTNRYLHSLSESDAAAAASFETLLFEPQKKEKISG